MLDYSYICDQVATTIRTLIIKNLSNELFIVFAIDSYGPLPANFPTELVKKHADQLVGNV
jgi:hypothetical protein